MAQVPGLRPFTEDRPSVDGRVGGRVQVQTPQYRSGLRATTSPVDTYVRPQRPGIEDGGLAQLAQSLSSLNPTLARFANTLQQEKRQEVDAAATAKIGGMTKEERDEAVKNGLPEFADPWFRAAWMKQYGQGVATEAYKQARLDYVDKFDRENGDINTFLAEHQKAAVQTLQNDKHALSGFNAMWNQYATSIQQGHISDLAKLTNEKKVQTVASGFDTIYEAGKSQGATPDTIASTVWTRVSQNKDLMRMSFDDQHKQVILPFLHQIANSGDEATVNAIIDFDRGNGVGKLSSVPSLKGDLMEIQNLAKRKNLEIQNQVAIPVLDRFRMWADNGELEQHRKEFEEWQAANNKLITPDQAVSMWAHNRKQAEIRTEKAQREAEALRLEQTYQSQMEAVGNHLMQLSTPGSGPGLQFVAPITVMDPNGNPKQLDENKLQDMAVNDYLNRVSPTITRERNETPEQTFNREAEWLTHNGQVKPQWKNLLNQGYIAASPATTTGEKVPQALPGAVELYGKLRASNPNLLKAHVKDNHALDFYESYYVAKQYGGLDDKEAYVKAVQATRETSPENLQAYRQRYEDISNKVQSMNGGWVSSLFGGWSSISNTTELMDRVERVAQLYVRTGLSTDLALEEAAKLVKSRYTEINGRAVYTGDTAIGNPEEFKTLALEKVKEWAAKYGKDHDLDASDLSIMPITNGNGAWLIVRKANDMPAGDATTSVFTLRDLAGVKERLASQQASAIAKAKEDRLNPLWVGENSWIGPPKLTGWTPQEDAEIIRRAEEQQARIRAAKKGSTPFGTTDPRAKQTKVR